MTARDLLQQRTTTPTGDTVWRLSPLVEAAMQGKMAVLDGLHRVHKGELLNSYTRIHSIKIKPFLRGCHTGKIGFIR